MEKKNKIKLAIAIEAGNNFIKSPPIIKSDDEDDGEERELLHICQSYHNLSNAKVVLQEL
jgi:hypothetical protein